MQNLSDCMKKKDDRQLSVLTANIPITKLEKDVVNATKYNIQWEADFSIWDGRVHQTMKCHASFTFRKLSHRNFILKKISMYLHIEILFFSQMSKDLFINWFIDWLILELGIELTVSCLQNTELMTLSQIPSPVHRF